MFLLRSESDLLAAFRPRDRRALELPPGLSFPHTVHDYLSWVDTSGFRVFLVFAEPVTKKLRGIAFRREPVGAGGPSQLCEWCHSHGSSEEIGLLTTDKSSRKRLGVALCRDLRCKQRLEQAADLSGRSPREPIRRVLERMQRFAREGLGIEADAA